MSETSSNVLSALCTLVVIGSWIVLGGYLDSLDIRTLILTRTLTLTLTLLGNYLAYDIIGVAVVILIISSLR